MSAPAFAVGDRVTAVGVAFPATGIVTEVHGEDRYTVEWQTDFLTEVLGGSDIERQRP